MPDLGGLFAGLLGLIGEVINATSLRLGVAAVLTTLAVMLVLLSLVARPASRWTTRDLGRLAGVGRAMAMAAESGGAATFSLGTAGIARSVPAPARLQTLAALPILSHVGRAAARSGVPIQVSANDPVAVLLAEVVLDDAHRVTETRERVGRSAAVYVGEGRSTAAWRSLSTQPTGHAAFVVGDLAFEAAAMVDGETARAAMSSLGTASATQSSVVLLGGDGTLIGPELFLVPADLRSATADRAASHAGNRLMWAAVALLVFGSVLALMGVADLAAFLVASE
jgi:hypothetical protein